MNIMGWLVRANRWARNPPSPGRVKLVFGVIAVCLLIVGLEWAFGWPEWLTPNRLNPKP